MTLYSFEDYYCPLKNFEGGDFFAGSNKKHMIFLFIQRNHHTFSGNIKP